MIDDGDGGKIQSCRIECKTCYRTCFKGFLLVHYNDSSNIEYDTNINVYTALNNNTVDIYLEKTYPRNTTIQCYYNNLNHAEIKLELNESIAYVAIYGLCTSIAGVIFIVWVTLEILAYYQIF